MRKEQKIICLITLWLSLPLFILGQQSNRKIDSLLAVVTKSQEDTNKVKTFNSLSIRYRNIQNYTEAKKFAEKALELAQRLNYEKGKAVAHSNIGEVYWETGENQKSLDEYFEVMKIWESVGDKYGVADAYFNIGVIYTSMNSHQQALRNLELANKIFEKLGEKERVAGLQLHLGNIYNNMGDYLTALKIFLSALKSAEAAGNKFRMAGLCNNIGIIYKWMKRRDDALSFYYRSIKLYQEIGLKTELIDRYFNICSIYQEEGNFTEVLKNMKLALKISEEINDQRGIAVCYHNIGLTYYSMNNYSEAKKHYEQAYAIFVAMNDMVRLSQLYADMGRLSADQDNYSEASKNYSKSLELLKNYGNKFRFVRTYLGVSEMYMRQKEFASAREFANKALDIARESQIKLAIIEVYGYLQRMDSAAGDFRSALANHKLFMSYKESLLNEENSKKLVEIQMKHDFEKKEDSLNYQQVLTNEKLIQQTILTNQMQQSFLLKERELLVAKQAGELKEMAYIRTQKDLEIEQALRTGGEKELLATKSEKSLQDAKLKLQAAELTIKQKDLKATKTLRNVFIAGSFGLLLLSFFIYRNFRNHRKASSLMSIAAEKQKVELQLQSLRAQLNPHFMFNSLNAIQALIIRQETDNSQLYLERFARLLRLMLENADQPFVTLRKEIYFLELYLSLEKLRIPELDFNIKIDPAVNADETFIPNMMLQPYLENALWHGLQHKPGHKELNLNILKAGDRMIYEVKDNGVGRQKSSELKSQYQKGHTSKGMELLSKRFSLLSKEFGEDIQANVSDVTEAGECKGTIVTISVPVTMTNIDKVA